MKISINKAASVLLASSLSTVFTLTGCSTDTVKSSDVKQSVIYRSYVVSFDQRTLTTTMFANFRVGGDTGTNVELEKPSDVSVSGQGLNLSSKDKKLSSALGANYQWEAPTSSASPEVKFIWTRQDGSSVEDKLSPPSESAISLATSQFSISDGIVIRLNKPAETTEVSITVTSEASDSKDAFVVATKRSASEYVVKAADLVKFKPGKIRLEPRFTSRLSIPKSDLDLGGVTSYEIRSLPVSTEIK